MRKAEVMENPKAEGFNKDVYRYRAQRTLGNKQGNIPREKVWGAPTQTPAAGTAAT